MSIPDWARRVHVKIDDPAWDKKEEVTADLVTEGYLEFLSGFSSDMIEAAECIITERFEEVSGMKCFLIVNETWICGEFHNSYTISVDTGKTLITGNFEDCADATDWMEAMIESCE